jgi:hypothetical protein
MQSTNDKKTDPSPLRSLRELKDGYLKRFEALKDEYESDVRALNREINRYLREYQSTYPDLEIYGLLNSEGITTVYTTDAERAQRYRVLHGYDRVITETLKSLDYIDLRTLMLDKSR